MAMIRQGQLMGKCGGASCSESGRESERETIGTEIFIVKGKAETAHMFLFVPAVTLGDSCLFF